MRVKAIGRVMDHIAHRPDLDGQAFHLVNPEPQPVVDVVNAFCAAAGAPRFATPVDRGVTRAGPLALLPRAVRPSTPRADESTRNLLRHSGYEIIMDVPVTPTTGPILARRRCRGKRRPTRPARLSPVPESEPQHPDQLSALTLRGSRPRLIVN